jgi:hypothetical protein
MRYSSFSATILPATMRLMIIPLIETRLPVGVMPMNSPGSARRTVGGRRLVTPGKAGVQNWIPAGAGMTCMVGCGTKFVQAANILAFSSIELIKQGQIAFACFLQPSSA